MPIPAGEPLLGSNDAFAYPEDGEGPVRRVRLDAFGIAPHAVTNAEFARFVEATGYRTEAERFGWSFVFAGLLPDDFPPTRGVASAPWWRQVEGASWRTRRGRSRILDGRDDHPVVHVSWNDARRLLRVGRRAAADRGRVGVRRARRARGPRLPWGDELEPGGEHRMNVWQGDVPDATTPSPTASTAPRRSTRSRPTATGSTT